ncbi:MAG: hypothetical protein A3D24_03705 [Candidatus Blackburnbacteria bacterium RIFCSPHIGHO2_02_FULL_39_13]|uniref:Uncharacterized protein n=1 Tax=Candidatus Blackburnbacteria bacterium RIFCSPLOWO2_01_FULL_40_20 TaxID=1797519 RepID=A0A1G1VF05_9BACT|nr:MAG: hypothetical protein UT38_C0016G0006 [Microgenomates group bacterium GW2011_GWA2_39_19]OGY07177.1 MAG: hypothetical protein A2694_01305 [Candidatus Blackburnbacteria bacterium RIFCSPHIGHO2_01_FULL_40_17]OGY10006.1 MAG: hypothetical protein A3D24_03705 [Candidatus Blackburnbacteria bacterium RIFCSPHIGHO2_02_FULL_39_13]OGY13951.1 MAG: hypothetical protein A3A77_04105 [Candidatus Blackburnbacteria bacterium RIFCSPLOWO2_01_FULL_40_20]HBL52012.1 hypothetical protein [Candidatus Blackburnbact
MDQSAQDNLRQKLKLRHLDARDHLAKNHPHALNFFNNVALDLGRIRRHSSKLLTAGTLGGALLLAAPQVHAQESLLHFGISSTLLTPDPLLTDDPKAWLTKQFQVMLPSIKNPWALPFLSPGEEKIIGKAIERATNVRAVATLEGEHLNTTYGYIGAEQHLMRFPGDSIELHSNKVEGMALSRGGFGWFTENGKLTSTAVEREKYYVAVQTLYLPDWDKRWKYLVGWYKWRKVIIVNTDNGNAVIAVVGDAGPAVWTGKHFGGSPEVMYDLGGKQYKKGRVLLFFVDDPENKIPLGKVNYRQLGIAPAVAALRSVSYK